MPHVTGHVDLTVLKELRFVIEFDPPVFDSLSPEQRSSAGAPFGKARVDFRLYMKEPIVPPGITGVLKEEDLKFNESMIDSDFIIADLEEWVTT